MDIVERAFKIAAEEVPGSFMETNSTPSYRRWFHRGERRSTIEVQTQESRFSIKVVGLKLQVGGRWVAGRGDVRLRRRMTFPFDEDKWRQKVRDCVQAAEAEVAELRQDLV